MEEKTKNFTINTKEGVGNEDNISFSISNLEDFKEFVKNILDEPDWCIVSESKNIKEMCNAIIYLQENFREDSEYEKTITNFIEELNNSEKYKKFGYENIKNEFINEFKTMGKNQVGDSFEFNFEDSESFISSLGSIVESRKKLNEKLDKIEDLLLNPNSKTSPSLITEYENKIVKEFTAYASGRVNGTKYIGDLDDIIDAKIKEIVGEEEYKIYTGESEDAGEGLSEALSESINMANYKNRLSYSQNLILKGYKKVIKDITALAKEKIVDGKSVVEAFSEVLEEMAAKVKFNELKEEFFKKNESTKSTEGFDRDTLKKFFEEKFNKQNEEINKNHENKKNEIESNYTDEKINKKIKEEKEKIEKKHKEQEEKIKNMENKIKEDYEKKVAEINSEENKIKEKYKKKIEATNNNKYITNQAEKDKLIKKIEEEQNNELTNYNSSKKDKLERLNKTKEEELQKNKDNLEERLKDNKQKLAEELGGLDERIKEKLKKEKNRKLSENEKNLTEELEQNKKGLNDTKIILDKIDVETVKEEFRKAQNPTEEELKEKEEFLTKRIEEIEGIYKEQIDNIVESDKNDDKKEEDLENLTSENEDIGVDNKEISKKYRYALAANMKDLEKVKLKKYNYKIERANKIGDLLNKLQTEKTLNKKELKKLLEKEKLNNEENARLTELNSKKEELNEQEQKELTELERRNKFSELLNNLNNEKEIKVNTDDLKGDLEKQKADLEKQKDKSIKDIVGILKQEAGEIKREYYEARYTKINEEKKIFTENMFGEEYSKKGLSPDDKKKIAESVQDRKTVLGVYNYCLLPFLDFEYNNKTYMNHKGEKQKMARKHNPIADLFWKIQENRRSVINGEEMKHNCLKEDSRAIKLQLKEFFTMIPNENLKKINEVLSIDGVKEKMNEICSHNGKSLVGKDFNFGDFLKKNVSKKCEELENKEESLDLDELFSIA